MKDKVCPVGIVLLNCDYESFESDYRKTYYEIICKGNTYINRFVFLDDDLAVHEETFESKKVNFSYLEKNNNIVVSLCGNEIVVSKLQLNLISTIVAGLED